VKGGGAGRANTAKNPRESPEREGENVLRSLLEEEREPYFCQVGRIVQKTVGRGLVHS